MHAEPRHRPLASLAPVAGEHALGGRAFEGAFGLLLLALLLLSTLDQGVAPLARGLVLLSFALLAVVNGGAALGVCIGATAIFSVHHFEGQGSWVQRPDNYAFLLLMGYLAIARSFGRSAGVFGWTAVATALLLTTALLQLLHVVGLSAYEISWYIRSFIMPLGAFVLLRRAAFSGREVHALFLIVAALATYFAIVTLLEVAGLYELIVPPWLGDPVFNHVLGDLRAGGLPMQPEWNAIDISLGFCVLLLRLDLVRSATRVAWIAGGLLCLLAIYFTYTRAAWLGLLIGGVPLFWSMSGARGMSMRRRALFLVGAAGFAALVLFFPSEVLRNRASDAGTVYFRFSVWVAGLEMMAQHPILGVGFAQFAPNLSAHMRDLVWIPPADAAQEGTLAHNTFVSVGAEFGIVGLALYVVVLVGAYRAARGAAGRAWGRLGECWVDGYILVYLINVQFITAHKLTSNLLFFGVMGAVAGMRAVRPGTPAPTGVRPGGVRIAAASP